MVSQGPPLLKAPPRVALSLLSSFPVPLDFADCVHLELLWIVPGKGRRGTGNLNPTLLSSQEGFSYLLEAGQR